MYSHLHKFFSKFPVVDLGDIKLRDLMLSDKEGYLEMMLDPEGVQYLSDEDLPKTLDEAADEIKYWGGLFYRKQSVFWAIADSKTDEFMGTIGFNNWNFYNGRAEISYDLLKKHWGKGIMTKALSNALIVAFKSMQLYRVEARTMQGNKASHRLLEKTGFKLEGVQRGYRFIREKREDIMLFGLVKPDFAGFLNE